MTITEEQRNVLRRAIKVHGATKQWEMCVEECAELIVAIKHGQRNKVSSGQIADEVADVIVMMEQAKLLLGNAIVERIVAAKIERLAANLANQERADREVTP